MSKSAHPLSVGTTSTPRLTGRGSNVRLKALLLAATACGSAMLTSAPARAQSAKLSEIIVTARKRQESILNVPVIETAIPQERLARLQTNNIMDLVTQVPGLLASTATATSGLQVSIRGVGNSTGDPVVDQAVALFVDGQQFSQGMAYAAAMFDVGQVEVLKGPQSLFYGKSSPGGVISIRTADPTSTREVVVRAAYEPEAHQRRGELILSGPVSDTLRVRLAGMYEKQDSYYYNNAVPAPNTGSVAPRYKRTAPSQDYVVRATALWNPTSKFDARLKWNSYQVKQINGGTLQIVSCPSGTTGLFAPFLGNDNCKLDRTANIIYPDNAAFNGTAWYDVPQQRVRIQFGSAELNYHPTSELTLTSVTTYYNQHVTSEINGSSSSAAGPAILVQNKVNRQDFTQEFRLNSEFSGPLNFTGGAYYQDAHYVALQNLPINSKTPPYNAFIPFIGPLLQAGHSLVHIYSYSVFGQARFKVTPELELAAGARWTDEIRRAKVWRDVGTSVFIPIARPRIQSKPLMPELTVTYKPQDTLTVFGSWKKGFKSGNFNGGSIPAPGGDIAYGDEKVKGFEGGVKGLLLDRHLSFELDAYSYKYSDLQVGVTLVVAGSPTAKTINAAEAKVHGIDFATSYRPPEIDGLTFDLNGEWNHGNYGTFNNNDCYYGQTIAQGCNLNFFNGQFNSQDLSGAQLVRAPRWQVNFGFTYEFPFADGMKVAITNNNNYTSKYPTLPGTRGDMFQGDFMKADLGVTLSGKDDRWEVAVIGKNITSKLTGSNCSATDLANAGFLTGNQFGKATPPANGVAAVGCRLDPGREIWLRVTYKPIG